MKKEPGSHSHFFRDVLVALARSKVDFVLAGGVAMVLHGAERMTLDLDLAVNLVPESVKKLGAVMEEFGCRPMIPVSPAILANPVEVQRMMDEKNALVFTFQQVDPPHIHVDVFIRPELSFQNLSKDADKMSFQGEMILVCSKKKLLSLKKDIDPPRDKDQYDIRFLEKALKEG